MPQRDQRPARVRDEDEEQAGPYQRRFRDLPQDTVRRLVEEIGARPATSLGEARAAAYLDGRLRRAGLRVSADTFAVRTVPGWERPLTGLLILVGLLIYYWLPIPALLLDLVALGLLGVLLARSGASLLGRERPSQNVIATRASTDIQRHRLVLLAPLDTPPIPQVLAARLGSSAIPILRVMAAGVLILFAMVGLFDPRPIWLYLQYVPALYLVVLAGIDVYALRGRTSTHVADAAGLAVLLASCEALDELAHTEVWAVGLGAVSSGAGLMDLLRRYPFDQASTLFVGLEGFGNGGPLIVERSTWPTHLADPMLLDHARQVGADPRLGIVSGPIGWNTPLAATLRRRGWRAITLACRAPAAHALPVQDDVLDRAAMLVIGLARAIDAEH